MKMDLFLKCQCRISMSGPILDSEGMGAFFGAHFSEKGYFAC